MWHAVLFQKQLDKQQTDGTTDDQQYHDDMTRAKLLSLDYQKPPIAPDPLQDPKNDSWLQSTRQTETEDKDSVLKQVLDRMSKLEAMMAKQIMPHTPVATRIDTPTLEDVLATPAD